jgi:hypothetical protein
MKTPQQLLPEIEARAFVLRASGLPAKRAMRRAAKEIPSRERSKAAGGGASAPSSSDATSSLPSRSHVELMQTFERWISHIWARKKRKSTRVIPGRNTAPEPSINENPVVVVEPQPALTSDPRLQAAFPTPLVVTGFQNARIIPNSEYPARYHDRTTDNWRASIIQNEELAKHRAQASAAHRNTNRSKYVG